MTTALMHVAVTTVLSLGLRGTVPTPNGPANAKRSHS